MVHAVWLISLISCTPSLSLPPPCPLPLPLPLPLSLTLLSRCTCRGYSVTWRVGSYCTLLISISQVCIMNRTDLLPHSPPPFPTPTPPIHTHMYTFHYGYIYVTTFRLVKCSVDMKLKRSWPLRERTTTQPKRRRSSWRESDSRSTTSWASMAS